MKSTKDRLNEQGWHEAGQGKWSSPFFPGQVITTMEALDRIPSTAWMAELAVAAEEMNHLRECLDSTAGYADNRQAHLEKAEAEVAWLVEMVGELETLLAQASTQVRVLDPGKLNYPEMEAALLKDRPHLLETREKIGRAIERETEKMLTADRQFKLWVINRIDLLTLEMANTRKSLGLEPPASAALAAKERE